MDANNGWYKTNRLAGLRRFAIAITLLNLLGHTVLGFEQSWAQPLVAVGAAYPSSVTLDRGKYELWHKRRSQNTVSKTIHQRNQLRKITF
jgi:hypothetical protein